MDFHLLAASVYTSVTNKAKSQLSAPGNDVPLDLWRVANVALCRGNI